MLGRLPFAILLVSPPALAFDEDCGLEPPGSFVPSPVAARPFELPATPGEPPHVRHVPADAPAGVQSFPPHRTRGGALLGKTVYVSAGHGFTWNTTVSRWRTQRGNTHDLVEDLVSIETANQLLVPLLENAGARVVTVRERDLNPEMVLVDDGRIGYSESGDATLFADAPGKGFGIPAGLLQSGQNPFESGKSRLLEARSTATASATYAPNLPRDGLYAVYVAYTQDPSRVSDAHYAVRHPGGESHFRVNQRRHGKTWVFLGRFFFRKGHHPDTGSVVVWNDSRDVGRVSLDAVRFGGGRGLLDRSGGPSGRPRFEEAARYHAQFSGAPPSVYDHSSSDGNDDVGTRSRFAAWDHEAGEDAIYLAWHTNAPDPGVGTSSYVYGPNPPDGTFQFTGVPGSDRLQSHLHAELVKDLRAGWDPKWRDRGKNTAYFGEVNPAHNPEMPSCLLEVAFHATRSDATQLKEPGFRLIAARAILQGIIRFFAEKDGVPARLPPEPPVPLVARRLPDGRVQLEWRAPPADAKDLGGHPPSSYVVYQSEDGASWDEGTPAPGDDLTVDVPGRRTRYFRVASVNAGGESLPSQVLGVLASDELPPALLVSGFERLDAAMGRHEDLSAYALGRVLRVLHGQMNDGASLARHGQALANARHAFDSVSREGLSGAIRISDYRFADYFAGRGMRAGVSLGADEMRVLRSFSQSGGALLLSGSHVASDLAAGGAEERAFLSDVLKAQAGSSPGTLVVEGSDGTLLTDLTGMALDDGTQGSYRVEPLGSVVPAGSEAIATFSPSGAGAAVATRKGPRVVFLAFPLEGVVNPTLRDQIVARILSSIEPDRPPPPDAGAPAVDAGLPAVGDPAITDAGLDAPPLPRLPWSGAGGDSAPRGCGCTTGPGGTPDPTPTALLLAAASLAVRRKKPWALRVRHSP